MECLDTKSSSCISNEICALNGDDDDWEGGKSIRDSKWIEQIHCDEMSTQHITVWHVAQKKQKKNGRKWEIKVYNNIMIWFICTHLKFFGIWFEAMQSQWVRTNTARTHTRNIFGFGCCLHINRTLNVFDAANYKKKCLRLDAFIHSDRQ